MNIRDARGKRQQQFEELVAAGASASTAYRKTDPDGAFPSRLIETDGLLSWEEQPVRSFHRG